MQIIPGGNGDKNLLTKNQIRATNKKQDEKNECILKHAYFPTIRYSKNIDRCHHIASVTTDLVWASDNINNLTLTNTVSDTLRQLTDLCCGNDRSHAVTNKDELMYKDNNFNIIKLYNDIKTNTKLIKHMDIIRIKLSLYCSTLNGDIQI